MKSWLTIKIKMRITQWKYFLTIFSILLIFVFIFNHFIIQNQLLPTFFHYKIDPKLIVLTLRIFFSKSNLAITNPSHPSIMPPLYFLVVWVSLLHYAISHILIPPFLPDGNQKQYYEQKFRISQLDNAVFKISGLPRDIFWTSNGTIFGTPSNFGQWTINIAYDSLT